MRVSGEVGVVKFDPEEDVRFTGDGKCWVKFRGVTKERKRDANGTWADGDALFLDYIVFDPYAKHFAESLSKGDTVNIEGELGPNNWTDKEGNTHEGIRVTVKSVGACLLWNTAKTPRTLEQDGAASAVDAFGGEASVITDEVPF
jgi:single-stranded DNA-binding protein